MKQDISIVVQNNTTQKRYDISNAAGKVTLSSQITGQPTKCTFSLINVSNVDIANGSTVSITRGKDKIFYGFVFNVEYESDKIKLTCYGPSRYLKYKDTIVVNGETVDELFTKLCGKFNVPCVVKSKSNYKMTPQIYEAKNLSEIVNSGINETLANSQKWYVMYDDFDKVAMQDIEEMVTGLVISNKSMGLSSVKFKASIDTETYNQIKLTKDNSKTKKRDVFIVKDSESISKFGLLQYYEKVDSDMNEAQIKSKAENLLKIKNKETKSLEIPCVGDFRVRAGVGLIVELDTVEKFGVKKGGIFFVSSCEHTFDKYEHKMKVTLELGGL